MSGKFVLMKKSRKKPCVGDVFVLQPYEEKYYFGKVIQTNLESTDSFVKGMNLIYIYDFCSNEKKMVDDFDSKELLISPMVVNNQPWIKGYFETIGSNAVTMREQNIDFGFWDVIREKYVDINRKELDKQPTYCSIFGLGSYGAVEKEFYKAIDKMQITSIKSP